jgi:hypothetical protein
MAQDYRLSRECIDRLVEWVRTYCPCALDGLQREFIRGILFICEEEARAALERERKRLVQLFNRPSTQ